MTAQSDWIGGYRVAFVQKRPWWFYRFNESYRHY